MNPFTIVIGIIIVITVIEAVVVIPNLAPWTRALMAGCKIPVMRVVGMRLRRVNPDVVVDAYIQATKAELGLSVDQLEAHTLAGGKPQAVVGLMVKAKNRDLNVPFEIAAKTDLAGFDLEAVNPDELSKAVTQPEVGR